MLTVVNREDLTLATAPSGQPTGDSLLDEIVRECARQVLTSTGVVQVVAARVNDKHVDEITGEWRFASVVLPA